MKPVKMCLHPNNSLFIMITYAKTGGHCIHHNTNFLLWSFSLKVQTSYPLNMATVDASNYGPNLWMLHWS